MSGQPALIRAYLYLQVTSLINAVLQRLRRLRQPKYLFGAIVGGAYFYFLVFRRGFRQGNYPGAGQVMHLSPGLAPVVIALAALVLFVIVVLAWFVPSDRAALQFSEAEAAFLFPAPVARRTLVQFKLLHSQVAIFFSAFLMALLFRRNSFLGANALQQAAGWWFLLSIMRLHFIGASFTRERLLDLGVNPLRRRLLVAGIVFVLVGGGWWWLRMTLPAPTPDQLIEPKAMLRYIGGVFASAPVSWWLAPFKLAVAPLFSPTSGDFLHAALPALLLLAAHYVWVLRSDVAFEEASIEAARRRAERVAAMREGRLRFGNAPAKARTVPFALAPRGFVPVAFLWKSLIALGPMYRLKTWLIACVVVIVGSQWLATGPVGLAMLRVAGGVALGFGVFGFMAGPMFMQRGLRQTLEHLDILKASPLSGWQIVLGELLSPMVLMTFGQWLLLLIAALAFRAGSGNAALPLVDVGIGAVGIALIAPPLCGLMLCVPFAGVLYFPAWSEAAGSRSAGVEVMGQRMIFFGGYLLTLLLVLLPVALLAGIAFLATRWLAGVPVALVLTTVVACAVLAAELAAAVLWLGGRVERIDLSQELPR